MANDLIELLRQYGTDPRFGRVVTEALDFISSSTIEQARWPRGGGQSSRSLADLHAFRKRSGYYSGPIAGLDETIDALSACNTLVRLGVVEMDRGFVAVWINEHDLPVGIMILKTKGPLSPTSEQQ